MQTREDRPGEPYPYDTRVEESNPTVLPRDLLATYHFIFLIRHPKYSIPSYYRCTLPPLDKLTGWDYLRKDEAGYSELRELFDFLRKEGLVGPKSAGQAGETNGTNGTSQGVEICVIDADDLLDNPSGMIEAVCKTTGIDYKPEMLVWDTEEDQALAKREFEKWKGFHEDAIDSTELRARTHVGLRLILFVLAGTDYDTEEGPDHHRAGRRGMEGEVRRERCKVYPRNC